MVQKMRKSYSNAWSDHDDSILARIVIQHIKNGSTQLKAFEEVGQTLSRTASACGFRWNSNVRKKYKQHIKAAKEYRQLIKNDTRLLPRDLRDIIIKEIDFDSLISFLQYLKIKHNKTQHRITQLKSDLEEINKNISILKKERDELQSLTGLRLGVFQNDEDYQALLRILQHADLLLSDFPENDLHHEKLG